MRRLAAFLFTPLLALALAALTLGPGAAAAFGNRVVNRGVAGFTPPSGTWAYFEADQISGGLANNDPVSSWTDLSGNGRHVTKTGSERPTFLTSLQNGLPGVRFDGSNDLLEVGSVGVSTVSHPFTIHMVVAHKNTATDAWTAVGGWIWRCQRWGNDGKVKAFAGASLEGSANDIPDTNAHQLTYVFDGSSSKVFVDGVEKASGNTGSDGLDLLFLGAHHNGGSISYGQVDLFAVLIKTGGRDTATETYLKNKWGTP